VLGGKDDLYVVHRHRLDDARAEAPRVVDQMQESTRAVRAFEQRRLDHRREGAAQRLEPGPCSTTSAMKLEAFAWP
jgi:hypothetical protein